MSHDDVRCRVKIDILDIDVYLPDEVIDDGEGTPTPEAKTRAIEAACEALTLEVDVYLDGEDKPPTHVVIGCMQSDLDEVTVE